MELVDILVLGTSAEKRVGSNPTEGINNTIQYNTIQYNTIQYNTIQYNCIYTSIHL
jgi:hypothetical protein